MATPTLDEISATLENHAVFVVIAETLDAWQPPSTPEGRKVLHAHHLWAMEVRAKGRLLFAGPLDMGAHGPASPPSIGAPTGLLVLRAASKAEAEEMAQQDPLHRAGYRRNVVHAWSIRWGESEITSAVGAVLATPLR